MSTIDTSARSSYTASVCRMRWRWMGRTPASRLKARKVSEYSSGRTGRPRAFTSTNPVSGYPAPAGACPGPDEP